MDSSSDKDRALSYSKTFAKHGFSPKAMQWSSYKTAAVRYRVLASQVNVSGKTVLDAGCGMGDLLPYLLAKGEPSEYLGVDITADFVEVAQKHYDGYEFAVTNPFSDDFTGTFDIVISSGVMNANTPGWLDKRKEMITKLFSLCREVLVFNMAGSADKTDELTSSKVAYANSNEIKAFCQTLIPDVEVITGYHPKDFTVVMKR